MEAEAFCPPDARPEILKGPFAVNEERQDNDQAKEKTQNEPPAKGDERANPLLEEILRQQTRAFESG
jgi:hypothetical protein